MAARTICLEVPDVPPIPTMTIPGIGSGIPMSIRNMIVGATGPCEDARAFIQSVQPVLFGLGLPLCILGCVTAINSVFTSDFPFVDPAALPDLTAKCACLVSFTPLGYCQMLRGILEGVVIVLNCIVGLLNDIVALEAQVAALLSDPATLFAGQCLGANVPTFLEGITTAFSPVTSLVDATTMLTDLIGIEPITIDSLTGGTAAAVLEEAALILDVLTDALAVLAGICP